MADAADSKSAEGNLVRVRLSPRALCSRNDLATCINHRFSLSAADCPPIVRLRMCERPFAGVCFLDDKRVVQLQAADMVPYVERQSRAGLPTPLYPILSEGITPEDLVIPYSHRAEHNAEG
jgi:hypothetical protein